MTALMTPGGCPQHVAEASLRAPAQVFTENEDFFHWTRRDGHPNDKHVLNN